MHALSLASRRRTYMRCRPAGVRIVVSSPCSVVWCGVAWTMVDAAPDDADDYDDDDGVLLPQDGAHARCRTFLRLNVCSVAFDVLWILHRVQQPPGRIGGGGRWRLAGAGEAGARPRSHGGRCDAPAR